MHRITLILILCLLLPDMYIYLVYIVKRTRNILWRSVYWLPTVVLVAIYMYYIYMTGDNALSRHPQGIGRLAVAVMLFAVPKTAGNQPPFVIHHFPYAVQESPFSFRCPPASLHTSRIDIRDNRFCQYPLRSHCRYHAL